jgi:PiT family inorganic phosphate transporter
VTAHSIVLFLFASQSLESFLTSHGLPSIPLVPVSSSQAVVGAVIGIGLLKGGRGIRWRLLGGISSGWVVTPIIAAIFCFISLFFLQNVFEQKTYRPVKYLLSPEAMERIEHAGITIDRLQELKKTEFQNAVTFGRALSEAGFLSPKDLEFILESAEVHPLTITEVKINTIPTANHWITFQQKKDLSKLTGRSFNHKWVLDNALVNISSYWQFKRQDKKHNQELKHKLSHIYELFRTENKR